MKRVLLIEDQADFAAHVWQFLESRGFQMDHAATGVLGLKMLTEQSFDVVILDLGLPGLDGLTLCAQARARGNPVPILALTARDQLTDKLLGFDAGVDDYVVKPVALPELEARLLALLRRGEPTLPQLHYGPLTLNLSTMTLIRKTRLSDTADSPRVSDTPDTPRTILLTPKLGRLLASLMAAAPQTMSHAALIAEVWEGEAVEVNALHSQISNLRALIDRPFSHALLHATPGVGYALRA